MKYLLACIVIVLAIAGMAMGEAGDAPGLVLIGLILVAATVAALVWAAEPTRYLLALVASCVGVAGLAAGEADDSPGLMLLGVLVVVAAIVYSVRAHRQTRGADADAGPTA